LPNGKQEISANLSYKAFYDFLEQKLNQNFLEHQIEFHLENNEIAHKLHFDYEKKFMSLVIIYAKSALIVGEFSLKEVVMRF
jgi:hypothetical protein